MRAPFYRFSGKKNGPFDDHIPSDDPTTTPLDNTLYEGTFTETEHPPAGHMQIQRRPKLKRLGNKRDDISRSEVDIMSKIDHPHVIRLHGAAYDDILANQNIFFEWMAGGSVAQLLQKHGPFTDHVITSYLHQALLGLEYLHGLGILHRDLKGILLFSLSMVI